MKTSQLRFDKNATNCCKGVAVCLLVYFHLFGVQDEATYTAVIPVLRNILAPYGNVCVVFFVLLTGYGFAAKHISAKEPYSRQIVPRLWGLYQGYWFVFATMFVIYPLLCSPNRSLSIIYGDTLFVFVERFLLDFLGLSHLVFQFAPYSLNQTWWYMSLAVLLFLFLPLLCALYREIGWWVLGLVTALSVALPDLRYLEYFPALALGVCLAGSNGFATVRSKTATPLCTVAHLPVLFVGLLVWYRMRQNRFYIVQADALAAYVVCQCVFDLFFPIPGLRQILEFFGKHSANIFYTHSFLLAYWPNVSTFLYSLHYDLLIFAVTLALSLLLSLLLEQLKKWSGYSQLCASVKERCMEKLPVFAPDESA